MQARRKYDYCYYYDDYYCHYHHHHDYTRTQLSRGLASEIAS